MKNKNTSEGRMLQLTKLNGNPIFVNPHLIETMDGGMETRLFFMSGNTLMVKEPADEVIEKVISYRKALGPVTQEM